MLAINNKIFDSKVAANGPWRNISNLGAYSLHFRGLEGTVWVEVSNDPAVLTDGATISAPSAPTGQAVNAAPSQGNQGSFKAKITYVTPGGETTPSTASSAISVPSASQTPQVNAPSADAGGFAVGWNVYLSNDGGVTYWLQNSGTLSFQQSFILIDFTQGTPPPTSNTSGQPNAGINVAPGGNLTTASTGVIGETQVIADGAGNLVYNPSCINFNFIRVRKTGGGSTETIAYLFGQNV